MARLAGISEAGHRQTVPAIYRAVAAVLRAKGVTQTEAPTLALTSHPGG